MNRSQVANMFDYGLKYENINKIHMVLKECNFYYYSFDR